MKQILKKMLVCDFGNNGLQFAKGNRAKVGPTALCELVAVWSKILNKRVEKLYTIKTHKTFMHNMEQKEQRCVALKINVPLFLTVTFSPLPYIRKSEGETHTCFGGRKRWIISPDEHAITNACPDF